MKISREQRRYKVPKQTEGKEKLPESPANAKERSVNARVCRHIQTYKFYSLHKGSVIINQYVFV